MEKSDSWKSPHVLHVGLVFISIQATLFLVYQGGGGTAAPLIGAGSLSDFAARTSVEQDTAKNTATSAHKHNFAMATPSES